MKTCTLQLLSLLLILQPATTCILLLNGWTPIPLYKRALCGDIIVVARAVEVYNQPDQMTAHQTYSAEFHVTTVLKGAYAFEGFNELFTGSGGETQLFNISNFGNRVLCYSDVTVGAKYILFLSVFEGRLSASYQDIFGATEPYSEDAVRTVQRAVLSEKPCPTPTEENRIISTGPSTMQPTTAVETTVMTSSESITLNNHDEITTKIPRTTRQTVTFPSTTIKPVKYQTDSICLRNGSTTLCLRVSKNKACYDPAPDYEICFPIQIERNDSASSEFYVAVGLGIIISLLCIIIILLVALRFNQTRSAANHRRRQTENDVENGSANPNGLVLQQSPWKRSSFRSSTYHLSPVKEEKLTRSGVLLTGVKFKSEGNIYQNKVIDSPKSLRSNNTTDSGRGDSGSETHSSFEEHQLLVQEGEPLLTHLLEPPRTGRREKAHSVVIEA